MRRTALTLIELITVVTVTGILLAAIMPALGETRRRGKDTVCIQNLHRIIQASHIYAGRDPNESIIPVSRIEDSNSPVFHTAFFSQLPAYAYGGKSGIGTPFGTKSIATSPFGPGFRLSASDRPLNGILYRNTIARVQLRPGAGGGKWLPDTRIELNVYRCPSDSGYTGLHVSDGWDQTLLTSFDHFGTSYAANVFWVGMGSPSFLNSNSPYLRPLSRIANPVRTIAYMENNGRSAWLAPVDPCPVPGGFTEPAVAGGWHGKDWTFNTAFIDGGVETIRMRGYRPEPVPHNPLFPADISCITVRSIGWQIDTLPAPLIQTAHVTPAAGRRVP